VAPTTTTTAPAAGALGRIDGVLWLDLNRDGVHDANEPALPGQPVSLQSAAVPTGFGRARTFAAPTAQSTVTDSTGHYSFTDLPAGGWVVTAQVPAALTATYDTDGGADLLVAVTLPTGGAGIADMAAVGSSSVGGRFVDPSGSGLGGATVTIQWFGPDGVPGTADDVNIITTTDADGAYNVPGLPEGSYTVTATSGTTTVTADVAVSGDGVQADLVSPSAPADDDPATAPSVQPVADELPATGGHPAGPLLVGAGLLLLGGMALNAARRPIARRPR
jgi:hypothetical protein